MFTDETGRLREVCFTVYSVMISAGGCLGYLITAVNWNGSLVAQLFGSQVGDEACGGVA